MITILANIGVIERLLTHAEARRNSDWSNKSEVSRLRSSLKKRSFGTRPAHRLTILMTSLICGQSFAQSDAGPAELTVFAGLGFGGTFQTESEIDIKLDDDSSLGIIFDYEEGPDTQWEVLYLRQDTAADTSALFTSQPSIDTEIQYLQGGGTFRGSGNRLRPYLAGTVGLTHIDPVGGNTRSDTFWSISIGVGAQLRPSKRLGFRLEGRVFGTLVDSNSAIYCGSASGGSQCLFTLHGDVLWQSYVFAGVTSRF